MRPSRVKRALFCLLLPAFLLTLGACGDQGVSGPVEVDNSSWHRAVTPDSQTPDGRIFVMVQLTERPTMEVYAEAKMSAKGSPAEVAELAAAAAVKHLSVVRAEQEVFAGRLHSKSLTRTAEIYRLQRLYNGFAIRTTPENLAALARLPGVKGIHPIELQELNHQHSVPLIGAYEFWDALDMHGEGVKLGVIDTGIDYLHADFGGPGAAADYDNQDFTIIEAGTFPTAKVVGGWDFAGVDYNAGNEELDIPVPDPDPLDGHYHGTHVAGSASGLGMLPDGSTYDGSYDMSLDPHSFAIAPGVAPEAELYALKIFGDVTGSTMLSGAAVEWAVDPNGDGDPSDRLDVVNLSVGSGYGSGGMEATVFNNAVAAGLIVVASAGNSGDKYFITGAPAQAESVISVAAAMHDGMEFTAIEIEPGSSVTAGLYETGMPSFGPYPWAPITADLLLPTVVPGDPDNSDDPLGCAPFQFTDFTGKIALVDRGACNFTQKVLNAENAGALACVIANHTPGAGVISMGGTDPGITIPSMMITYELGAEIKTAMAVPETVTVTMDLANTITRPEFQDAIASFSSRGPVHDGPRVRLKPDITGPGVAILSALTLSGTDSLTIGGTSMSSPHVAGVMALLRQQHAGWTPSELKALVMNTATNDVYFDVLYGQYIGPGRVGAGRVDVANAMGSSVVAYSASAPAAVSVTFETLDVLGSISEPQIVTVRNLGTDSATYDLSIDLRCDVTGADFTLTTPGPVTVDGGASADITVTLTADAASMLRGLDPGLDRYPAGYGRYTLSEEAGYLVLTPQDDGQPLRVPLYAALRPASDMAATGSSVTPDADGLADIGLAGTGVATDDVTSLVTPFELKYVSPEGDLELGSELPDYWDIPDDWDIMHAASADLKYVGVTSDFTAQMIADPDAAWADSHIFFGVVTHGVWGSPKEVGMLVSIDLNQDQEPEFFVYVDDPLTDFFQATLYDSAWNEVGGAVFNGFYPVEYGHPFIPAFMSDAVVLPVPVAALGLNAGASEISFMVEYQWWPYWDHTPWLHYDLAMPGASFNTASTGIPTALDADGEVIAAAFDLEAAVDYRTGGVLLIHHHNLPGSRGEVLDVVGATCATDSDCPDPWNRYCDTLTGACVGCLDNSHCFEGGFCGDLRECEYDCTADDANSCSPGSFCDEASGDCIHDCTWSGSIPCADGTYCDAETGLCLAANSVVKMTDLDVGDANCPAGGVMIETGVDDNNNGVLDPEEVDDTQYVCNPEIPEDVLFEVTDADPADCPAGGRLISSGVDDNGDGVLDPDEVDNTWTVCNGEEGGSGEGLLVETSDAPLTECPDGGTTITVGVDANENGTLEPEEIVDSWNVCDDEPTPSTLVEVSEEGPGTNCTYGGQRIDTGLDDNGDGVLDADEIDNTTYICNGDPGDEGPAGEGGCGCATESTRTPSLLALLLLGLLIIGRGQKDRQS